MTPSIRTTIANTLRGLSADAVEQARSGHPGLPLGCAEIGAVLFGEVLKHDPQAPRWPDRDRFVLSAGHGSMLLYSLLHLTGYAVTMDDLRRFRQLGSPTAGHPEYGALPGVETTTGPLGQGLGNGVGMALAEAMLAERFNRPGFPVIDHYTYVLASDGDMMEGVASEAASLAGHLGLGKLIVIYDDNGISIEGETGLAFSESVPGRFRAYGWAVEEVDGHDGDQLLGALTRARNERERPSLVVARTRIAKGSPKEGSAEAHGAPLGQEAVAALKKALGLSPEPFFVPPEVYEHFAQARAGWAQRRRRWEELFAAWSERHPDLREEWDRAHRLALPAGLEEALASLDLPAGAATRQVSGQVLQALARALPYLAGGSADLAPSTNTYLKEYPSVAARRFDGRNLHFGVREHAMGAILNGMALHGGLRPFGATFLVFSDYMRPSIRLAALMRLPVLYVFTHDSIYVGEDGPTHQPVEHLEALRLIPNLRVFRPADPGEVREAWLSALRRTDGPTALILTRQQVPVLEGAVPDRAGVARGGYVIRPERGKGGPELVILASGSEVALACTAAARLEEEGRRVRVVSVPCRGLLYAQPESYRRELLGPPSARRLVIEAGVGAGWQGVARSPQELLTIERFGESGRGEEVARHLGLSVAAALERARGLLEAGRAPASVG